MIRQHFLDYMSLGQNYPFGENAITKLGGTLSVMKVLGCGLWGGFWGPLSVMKVW